MGIIIGLRELGACLVYKRSKRRVSSKSTIIEVRYMIQSEGNLDIQCQWYIEVLGEGEMALVCGITLIIGGEQFIRKREQIERLRLLRRNIYRNSLLIRSGYAVFARRK